MLGIYVAFALVGMSAMLGRFNYCNKDNVVGFPVRSAIAFVCGGGGVSMLVVSPGSIPREGREDAPQGVENCLEAPSVDPGSGKRDPTSD